MRKVRSLKFNQEVIPNKETSWSTTRTTKSTNSGTSSMLMNGRENQEKESSMKSSVCMLNVHSISFHSFQTTNILTSLTIEILLSRHQMEETPNNGTSTNSLLQLELSTTTNHGILRTQEELRICKSGAPTHNGSKSSCTQVNISATSNNLTVASMYSKERTKKCKRSKFMVDIMVLTRDGRFYMLTKEQRMQQRDSTKSMASTSTDHSISDQDCHSKELLSATVPTTSGSRDGERM